MEEERKNGREEKGFDKDGTGIIWLPYLLGKTPTEDFDQTSIILIIQNVNIKSQT
jgi:hypothetical protein